MTQDEKNILKISKVLGFIFGMSICFGMCYNIYEETRAPTSAYLPTEEWKKFADKCARICSPDLAVIIGEPFPGRVANDTYCLCASKPPKFAARWR